MAERLALEPLDLAALAAPLLNARYSDGDLRRPATIRWKLILCTPSVPNEEVDEDDPAFQERLLTQMVKRKFTKEHGAASKRLLVGPMFVNLTVPLKNTLLFFFFRDPDLLSCFSAPHGEQVFSACVR